MSSLRIEHVNLTVSDAERAARLMETVFGWHRRWQGPARDDGKVIHVGTNEYYLAFYAEKDSPAGRRYVKGEPLNHVAVEVENLDAIERKVIEAGLVPFSHGDYEPGRRFYFLDHDGIEFEIVSYVG